MILSALCLGSKPTDKIIKTPPVMRRALPNTDSSAPPSRGHRGTRPTVLLSRGVLQSKSPHYCCWDHDCSASTIILCTHVSCVYHRSWPTLLAVFCLLNLPDIGTTPYLSIGRENGGLDLWKRCGFDGAASRHCFVSANSNKREMIRASTAAADRQKTKCCVK